MKAKLIDFSNKKSYIKEIDLGDEFSFSNHETFFLNKTMFPFIGNNGNIKLKNEKIIKNCTIIADKEEILIYKCGSRTLV